jgi:hypothetical protein
MASYKAKGPGIRSEKEQLPFIFKSSDWIDDLLLGASIAK